jgi:hypothetical protein
VGYLLLDRPNPYGDHFYRSRRGSVLALVLHITAGLEDLDAHDDHSAESTAGYAATTNREVSWHAGSDADSWVDLLPAGFTAWHAAGYNSRTWGLEISKTTPDWRNMPAEWLKRTLDTAALGLAGKVRELRIPVRRASKAELDHAIATGGGPVGLIAHGELDPMNRRDPGYVAVPPAGDTFPWDGLLSRVAWFLNPIPFPTSEEDDMAVKRIDVRVDKQGKGFAVCGVPLAKAGTVSPVGDYWFQTWLDDTPALNGEAIVKVDTGGPILAKTVRVSLTHAR